MHHYMYISYNYILTDKINEFLITMFNVNEFQWLHVYILCHFMNSRVKGGGGGAQGGSHCNSQKCSIPCDMDGTGERRRRNESPLRNIKWTQNDIGRRKRRKRKIIYSAKSSLPLHKTAFLFNLKFIKWHKMYTITEIL